jgi:hypothetical protein
MGIEVIVGLVVRHALTVGAGMLMAKGYADADTANALVGGGAAAVAVAWSVVQKKTAGK